MKDAFGRELEIGQQVVYVWNGGSATYKDHGYVVGFTEKRVKFSRKSHGLGNCIKGSSLIILSEEGL